MANRKVYVLSVYLRGNEETPAEEANLVELYRETTPKILVELMEKYATHLGFGKSVGSVIAERLLRGQAYTIQLPDGPWFAYRFVLSPQDDQ